MKNYLVSYWNGIGVNSLVIEAADNYVPSKDNCELLKNEIIKKDAPEWRRLSCVANGGYVSSYPIGKIEAEGLKLVAVSNLDI